MCDSCGCNDHHHHDHDDNGHDHSRRIEVEVDVKLKNNQFAEKNRKIFEANCLTVINLLSSPGAGKTALLEKTIGDLKGNVHFGVIEGDLQTDNDKKRIEKLSVPVVQINTVSACHLDAKMIQDELFTFKINGLNTLFIENVGNLVCPATFDLGESFKVALLSVTEGDDKPAKYPVLFHEVRLVLITKTDLLPYVDFNVQKCREYIKEINPGCEIIEVSSKTADGMNLWYEWLQLQSK